MLETHSMTLIAGPRLRRMALERSRRMAASVRKGSHVLLLRQMAGGDVRGDLRKAFLVLEDRVVAALESLDDR